MIDDRAEHPQTSSMTLAFDLLLLIATGLPSWWPRATSRLSRSITRLFRFESSHYEDSSWTRRDRREAVMLAAPSRLPRVVGLRRRRDRWIIDRPGAADRGGSGRPSNERSVHRSKQLGRLEENSWLFLFLRENVETGTAPVGTKREREPTVCNWLLRVQVQRRGEGSGGGGGGGWPLHTLSLAFPPLCSLFLPGDSSSRGNALYPALDR